MLRTNDKIRKLSVSNDQLHRLTEQELKDVQKALLEMMVDFDAFCRVNNLCYFLCGGSALGAVRHQGFIPWDEDVDLAMPSTYLKWNPWEWIIPLSLWIILH